MGKENMIYIHDGISFSYKGECNFVTCRKMDGTAVCHVK
jgi:hypothetical protein